MKKTPQFALLVAVLSLSVFVSCKQAVDDPVANASRVVTGTITVSSVDDWANLKIGLFSGGDNGAYPGLDIDDGGLDDAADFRVIYSVADDGSSVALSRVGGATAAISAVGATSRDYSFELPSSVPGENVTYYYAAWLDADADGILDLKDSDPFLDTTDTKAGEFNRCANKATTDNDDLPTVLAITGFLQSTNIMDGTLTGNYKYSGYDTAAYNEQNELDSTENTSGFNFHMIADAGW